MRVLIAYNELGQAAGPDEADVLHQVAVVESSLAALGHSSTSCGCTLDLESLSRRLVDEQPDVVFNLVESLGGHDRLIALVPALLEALAIPFTGSSASAILTSTDKLGLKRLLGAASVPVPPVVRVGRGCGEDDGPRTVAHPVIVKSQWCHGSHGMLDDVVLEAGADLAAAMDRLGPRLGEPCFAERFIEGREINVSFLAGAEGLLVLPPAEIVFTDFPVGKPQFVGYRAKWETESFEYCNTPRTFDFLSADEELLGRVTSVARSAWQVAGLAGYGRVDVRIDALGRPWVLEVNANPCLSEDAGFAAALEEAGIRRDQAVAWILDAALSPAGRPLPTAAG